MTISQKIAAAVALRHLGYKIVAKPTRRHRGCSFQEQPRRRQAPTVRLDRRRQRRVDAIARAAACAAREIKPGGTVALSINRGGERLTVHVQTITDPQNKKHAIIGFAPAQAVDVTLPLKVRINARNVGGPSAGLAFALEVLEKLGHNVDRGYRVAVTGQIELNGAVDPIGGVKQKTFGARRGKSGRLPRSRWG